MSRFFLLGTAAAALFVGQAFGLTMTPTSDGRSTSVEASADFDFDSNSESPGAGFPDFSSNISANASSLPLFTNQIGGGTGVFIGASAQANAGQDSSVGALSISGSGNAGASGSGGFDSDLTASVTDGGIQEGFSAIASSVLEIFFSIDESAEFDLSAFLSSGLELKDAGFVNGFGDVVNRASISLRNEDSDSSIVSVEISDDAQFVDESGLIGPGNYSFKAEAYAEVFGEGGFFDPTFEVTDASSFPALGYFTSAGFEGASLQLTPTDRVIPEPVTTTLAFMGLGALALQTSRRRHV